MTNDIPSKKMKPNITSTAVATAVPKHSSLRTEETTKDKAQNKAPIFKTTNYRPLPSSTTGNDSSSKQTQPILPVNASLKNSQQIVPVYPDQFSNHPKYLSVMSMKVNALRKELRSLDLETGGLKKELQKRLLTALPADVPDHQSQRRTESSGALGKVIPEERPETEQGQPVATVDKQQDNRNQHDRGIWPEGDAQRDKGPVPEIPRIGDVPQSN